MLNICAVRQVVVISFMAILLNGVLAPMSSISLTQTTTEASVTNSTRTNFLTYEDTTWGFKMQYPSDWNKSNYPPTIPIVGFMSPAQNATDKFFENIIVAVYPLYPDQNNTLDEFSHAFIEQLGMTSSNPEFDVISPPEKTILGGIPAYNMTYTYAPPEDLDPPIATKPVVMTIWTVKDDKGYVIRYTVAEGDINHNIDNAAKKMIDSFELLSSQQLDTSEGLQTELENVTRINQTSDNFLTYFNSTYGVQIGYPQNWNVSGSAYPIDPFYGIAYIFPENETELDLSLYLSTERLPYQEITLDDYLDSQLELPHLNLSEANTNATTLAGRPAYKLVYRELIPASSGYTAYESGLRKVMEIGTIINGRVYQATYSTHPDRFLQNLPIIQRMLDTLKIVPTNEPPASPSVNDVEFLTYENSTYGIRMQYPSNWIPTDEADLGNITFVLPDEESNEPGLFDFMRPQEELPEALEAELFVEVIPLPYSYTVSESAYIDEFVPIWVSEVKGNLTDFNLTKSRATALDDSPAQILEFTYSDEASVEQRALSIFAVENNIFYHIRYQPLDILTSYYDIIPIIRKMIESFEILDTGGMRQEIF